MENKKKMSFAFSIEFKKILEKMEDVGRTGMIFEGFGIDHAHAKLFPMHGTKMAEWQPLKSNVDKYFEKYEGYISSHNYKRADDQKLAQQIIFKNSANKGEATNFLFQFVEPKSRLQTDGAGIYRGI